MYRVLLVEDEPTLAMIIKENLSGYGFEVEVASNGEEGMDAFCRRRPDVLVADVMMPRMDGFSMVERVRRIDREIPVLFLTARSSVDDVVKGFESGADDYLKKPFGMMELIVRIKALLGRASKSARKECLRSEYGIGEYVFNPIAQTLVYAGKTVFLSHRESRILEMLCQSEGQVLPSKVVLLELWGDDSFFNARSLSVFITRLRHHLSADPSIRIVNIRGEGYKLIY